MPSILVYGTGGVSFQQTNVGASCAAVTSFSISGYAVSPTYCLEGAHSESFSKVLTGYTLGGGIEGMIKDRWLGRLGVRYSDYGNVDHTFFAGTGDDVGASIHVKTWTMLAGLGYLFW